MLSGLFTLLMCQGKEIKHVAVKAEETEMVTQYNFNGQFNLYGGVSHSQRKCDYIYLYETVDNINRELLDYINLEKPNLNLDIFARFHFADGENIYDDIISDNSIMTRNFKYDSNFDMESKAEDYNEPTYGFDYNEINNLVTFYFTFPFIEQDIDFQLSNGVLSTCNFNNLLIKEININNQVIKFRTSMGGNAKSESYDIESVNSVTIPKENYTIRFLDMNGNVFNEQIVSYGGIVELPMAPEVEGYGFSGFYFLNEYYMPYSTFVKSDMLIESRYYVITYDVVLRNQNNEHLTTIRWTYFDKFLNLPNLKDYGTDLQYAIGWAKSLEDSQKGVVVDLETYKPTNNIALYLVMKNKNNIQFLNYDNSVISSLYGKVGESINIPETPNRNYYRFKGWKNLNSNTYLPSYTDTGYSYTIDSNSLETEQFIAVYEPINYTVQFFMEVEGEKVWNPSWKFTYSVESDFIFPTVMFDYSNLGSNFKHKNITIADNQSDKPLSWFIENKIEIPNQSASTIFVPVNVNVETEKVNIKFNIAKQKFNFNNDAKYEIEDGFIVTGEYGAMLEFPQIPDFNGYSFFSIYNSFIDEDGNVNGGFCDKCNLDTDTQFYIHDCGRGFTLVYNLKFYNLTLKNEDGTVIQNYEVKYNCPLFEQGHEIVKKEHYAKKGYTFEKFSIDILNMTMPATDLDVICYYKLDNYTINFYYALYNYTPPGRVNERGLIKTLTLTINDKILAPEFNLVGYDFYNYSCWCFDSFSNVNEFNNIIIDRDMDIDVNLLRKRVHVKISIEQYSIPLVDREFLYGETVEEPSHLDKISCSLGGTINSLDVEFKGWNNANFPFVATENVEITGRYYYGYKTTFSFYAMQRYTLKSGAYYDMVTWQTRVIGVQENSMPNPLLCGTMPYENQVIYDSVPGFKYLGWNNEIVPITEDTTYIGIYELPKFNVKYVDRRGELALQKNVEISLLPVEELQGTSGDIYWDLFKKGIEDIFSFKFGEFLEDFISADAVHEFYNAIIDSSSSYNQIYFMLFRPNLDEDIVKGLFKDFKVDVESRNLNYLKGTKSENDLIYFVNTDNYMLNGIDYNVSLKYDALIYAPVNIVDSFGKFLEKVGNWFGNVWDGIKNSWPIIVSCFVGILILCFFKPIRIVLTYLFRIMFFPFYLISYLIKKNKSKESKYFKELKKESKNYKKEKKIRQNSYDKVTKVKSRMLEKEIKAKEKDMLKEKMRKLKIEEKQKKIRQKSYKKLNRINKGGK